MRCANTEAIDRHLEEQNVAEIQYNHFNEAILSTGMVDRYLELEGEYNKIAENYGYDIDFTEWISDNV